MDIAIASAVGGLVGLVVVAGLAWWAWTSMRRRTERGEWFWQRAILRVKALVVPGPRGDVVRIRLAVHDNVSQTQRVLSHRPRAQCVPGELRDLLPRLKQVAAGLDDQLRLWQTEPNRRLVLDALPGLRERADTVVAQAVSLRATAMPHIEEADRLSRIAAEEELRSQLHGLDARVVDAPKLSGSSNSTT